MFATAIFYSASQQSTLSFWKDWEDAWFSFFSAVKYGLPARVAHSNHYKAVSFHPEKGFTFE